jgi:DNA modification methylase
VGRLRAYGNAIVAPLAAEFISAAQRDRCPATPGDRLRGLKPKDLIGVPWRVAFALQADGWYLRQDIIWSKPNPMPESVTDRCTKAHEYVFLLSKSERYYFDHEAIKEPVAAATIARLAQDVENQTGSDRVPGKTNGPMRAVGGRLAGNVRPPKGQLAYEAGDERQRTKAGLRAEKAREAGGYFTRNKRSVWQVATRGYKGAHFATYPPDLIEPCVFAGSKPGDLVLDPFGGSGTTAQVALQHGRRALLCELNPSYIALAEQRLFGDLA